MKIITKVIIDTETLEEIHKESYDYFGPLSYCCGASAEQKAAYATEAQTATTLEADFNKIFSGNQNILDTLTAPLKGIVGRGPGQFGMTPDEEAAQRTQATEAISSAGRQAEGVVRQEIAAQGGGNYVAPSGSVASIEASLAQDTAQRQAAAQEAITAKGYELGRENFFNASRELAAAPGELENPATGMESGIVGAEGLAGKTATDITSANNAWMGAVGGLVGGVLGGPIGAGIGKSIGNIGAPAPVGV